MQSIRIVIGIFATSFLSIFMISVMTSQLLSFPGAYAITPPYTEGNEHFITQSQTDLSMLSPQTSTQSTSPPSLQASCSTLVTIVCR